MTQKQPAAVQAPAQQAQTPTETAAADVQQSTEAQPTKPAKPTYNQLDVDTSEEVYNRIGDFLDDHARADFVQPASEDEAGRNGLVRDIWDAYVNGDADALKEVFQPAQTKRLFEELDGVLGQENGAQGTVNVAKTNIVLDNKMLDTETQVNPLRHNKQGVVNVSPSSNSEGAPSDNNIAFPPSSVNGHNKKKALLFAKNILSKQCRVVHTRAFYNCLRCCHFT